jgi:tetratricopeptide (TPR) repeat protein
LAQAGDAESARVLLDEIAKQQPNSSEALYQLGAVALERGEHAVAADFFARALAIEPRSFELMNNLAWVRATAPDDSIRDARAAVVLAERAVAATQRQDPALLDTLAASYAEAGRYAEAVKTAETAIDLARGAGHDQLARDVESRLNFYRESKPFRDTR